jgi:apolipoprotein N-acyltransferase
MSETSRRISDITAHPDAAEMRERFERVAESPRAALLDGMVVLLGTYLAISPWVVRFHGTSPELTANNLIIGLVLAGLGLGMALLPGRMYPLAWVTLPIGGWMIVSPWVATAAHSATKGMIWNNVCIGGIAIVLGLAASGMTVMAMRTRR